MITAKFNTKDFTKVVNNVISYSNEFMKEAKLNERKIAKEIADSSIEGFYLYLDGLARMHPGMLHHVYEWGQVGDPFARLFELNSQISGKAVKVSAEFLDSDSIPSTGTEPFIDKAEVMEYGETVVVTEKEAQALFFEIDGEEVFVRGPIVIPNPGGEAVRGSFVEAFNEFYESYFTQVYLKSINLYKEIEQMRPYRTNFKSAVKGSNARTAGKGAAQQWVQSIGGSLND